MQTLEDILKKVQTAIDDPHIIQISNIEYVRGTGNNYYSFFYKTEYAYRLFKKKAEQAPPNDKMQTLTEFYDDSFIQPILNLLNSDKNALAKLPEGSSQFVYNNTMAQPTAILNENVSILIEFNRDSSIMLIRTDNNSKEIFESIEVMLAKVFNDNPGNQYEFLKEKIAKAISNKVKSMRTSLKGAETRLKNAKLRVKKIEDAFESVPDSIKLLLEIGEIK